MDTELMPIAVKLFTGFWGLWLMTKILGKKEISQLTAFDFVSSLMLGELVGNTIYDDNVKMPHLLFALVLWTGMSLALEKIVRVFPSLAKPLSGTPDLIVRDGRIDMRAMRRNNLDFYQLNMLLREQNVFSLQEVAFALLETNGNLSVMKKSDRDTVTRSELGLDAKPAELPVVLIEDGRLDRGELRKTGRSEAWLRQELRRLGADSVGAVDYAEWTAADGVFIQLKQPPAD